jgi:outer membrane receptor for ferrienterochelin and colicin
MLVLQLAPVPPAVSAPADVIEIVGTRNGQSQKIDRRTYRVERNPQSAQKDAVQLLRGLPAVTISGDGNVNLLGAAGVQIFVDGRPYPGDSKLFLRSLHGSDIERIEIITNPSAQFSAEGTGGIVNFILRPKRDGVSGTLAVGISSFGRASADATAKYKHGPLAFEAEAHVYGGRDVPLHYHRQLSIYGAQSLNPTTYTEGGRRRIKDLSGEISGKVTYAIDPKTNVSAKIDVGGYINRATTKATFEGLTSDFEPFNERLRYEKDSSLLIGQFDFDHKGAREGETLTAGLNIYGHPKTKLTYDASFSNGPGFSTTQENSLLGLYGQVDWQRPIGQHDILSLGGSWNWRRLAERFQSSGANFDSKIEADTINRYTAINDTAAVYATFQHAFGDWNVMPGLRAEKSRREVRSFGNPTIVLNRTNLFPTLHIEHRFSKAVNFTASYGKRIERASEDMLSPYTTVRDTSTRFIGNPLLKDQATDSYEVSFHYRRKKVEGGLTLYDRETSRLWSTQYVTENGIQSFTYVNSGHRRDAGLELDVSSPLFARFKGNATVNVFYERAPVGFISGAGARSSLRYSANTTLEWTAPEHGKKPGDSFQLHWEHQSPRREFQLYYFPTDFVEASYTRSMSPTASLTASANISSATRRTLHAPAVREDYNETKPAEIKLKLLKRFGAP